MIDNAKIQGINVIIENFGAYMKTRPVHLADGFTIDALEDWSGPSPKADGFMWIVGLGWGAHDCALVSFTEEDGTELR